METTNSEQESHLIAKQMVFIFMGINERHAQCIGIEIGKNCKNDREKEIKGERQKEPNRGSRTMWRNK